MFYSTQKSTATHFQAPPCPLSSNIQTSDPSTDFNQIFFTVSLDGQFRMQGVNIFYLGAHDGSFKILLYLFSSCFCRDRKT